jgi:small multidrug resistance family-3 protein
MGSSQNNWLEATTTTSNIAQQQQQHHPVSALTEANNVHDDPQNNTVDWTAKSVVLAVAVFVAAGCAEIGGGWLVWQAVRGGTFQASSHNKISRLACCRNPWGMAIFGSLLLMAYGFIPTLQPPNSSFGRVYAVYGGFFIVLSFLAGWALDGDRPDRGDLIGGAVALAGVLLVLFWPR